MGLKTCGRDEVFVITGCCYKAPHVVLEGRVWLWPGQQMQTLSLQYLTVQVETKNVRTLKGVPLNNVGEAKVKLSRRNHELLAKACDNFLGKSEQYVKNFALEILANHQKIEMGKMTVEEIYGDRKKFCINLFENAAHALAMFGIDLVSYTIKELADDEGYLRAMGAARLAQMKKEEENKEAI